MLPPAWLGYGQGKRVCVKRTGPASPGHIPRGSYKTHLLLLGPKYYKRPASGAAFNCFESVNIPLLSNWRAYAMLGGLEGTLPHRFTQRLGGRSTIRS